MKLFLCDLTHDQQILNSDVMPAAIGSIAAYVQQELGITARLFKYPEKLSAALETEMPDVIGFSNYIWNFRLSYAFAERIRELSPGTFVVFGGPNFPIEKDKQEYFLAHHPAINMVVEHEGELIFSEFLGGNGFDLMDRLNRGLPLRIWAADHRADLATLPSPYLTGFMDEFFDGRLIPILQTNRGCPFSCTFCVEGMPYYSKVNRRPREVIDAEIDYIGRKIKQVGGRKDVYIADSNFGMYREDLETCQAIARSMDEHGWPEYINTTTGKNQKARVLEAAKLVRGALRLSGSVQSLDKDVLKNINRSNINEAEILDLALKAAELGANSYSEIILGLPGDTREKHLQSLRTIVDAGFQNVYTWQLMLLPGSELDTQPQRDQFGLQTRFRVLPRCFGKFQVRGKEVRAAEIEEVCVSSNTLNFDDYLYCRRIHLVIAIFYNDGLMGPFLKLLRMKNKSVFTWLFTIEAIGNSLFDDFGADTITELYSDRQGLALEAAAEIQDYVDGTKGNNLIFTYRVRALRDHLQDMVGLGAEVLREYFPEEAGPDGFIACAATYILHRAANLFEPRHGGSTGFFWYDMTRFEADGHSSHLPSYRVPKGIIYRFESSEWLKNQLAIYGDSEVGISRMLMKTNVSKLYRTAVEI